MKKLFLLSAVVLTIAGCTSSGSGYPEPIPGSITYNGQPQTRLTRSPIGSSVDHRFVDQYGRTVDETYIIQPDRSLLLVKQRVDVDVFED